jgi:hypothetical protein
MEDGMGRKLVYVSGGEDGVIVEEGSERGEEMEREGKECGGEEWKKRKKKGRRL